MEHRVVVVTGASRGIGAGLAKHFLNQQCRLGLCARTRPSVDTDDNVISLSVDVSDSAAVEAFADEVATRFGRIDLWINNAGVLDPIGLTRSVASADFARSLQINVLGVLHGTQAFVRHHRNTPGSGVLVNISSGAARNGYAGWSAYCAGKAAVDLLTECVQLEEADTGLRAYAMAPGVIDTDMQAQIRDCDPSDFPTVEKFQQLKKDDAFDTVENVAARISAIAFGDERPARVRMDLRE